MIARREFMIALGTGALVPLASFAQPARVFRIGYVDSSSSEASSERLEQMRASLRKLGYAEGKNIVIDIRWAESKYERLPGMAKELVALTPDVIVAAGSPAIRAAQQATATIPIVMVAAGDPVGLGFVASLSRPGGNTTGVSNLSRDLSAKLVELL